MNALTVLLIVSGLTMILMVFLRLFEIKRGKDLVSVYYRDKMDLFVVKSCKRTVLLWRNSRDRLANYIEKIPGMFVGLEKVIHRFLSNRFKHLADMIKGTGVNRKGGAVSFYLKSVSEYKKDSKE
jgi:hypothetical protein